MKITGITGLGNKLKILLTIAFYVGIISLIAFLIVGAMVVLRFWCGDHWLTDSIGGLILGVFAFGLYYFITSYIKDKKSLE